MKKIQVQKYVYERVLKTAVEICIPEKPLYFQEFNHRVIVGLFPQRATWGDNEVWEIKIVFLGEKKIELASLQISSLQTIISQFDLKPKTSEDLLIDKVVQYLLETKMEMDLVNKKYFDAKYQEICSKINTLNQ